MLRVPLPKGAKGEPSFQLPKANPACQDELCRNGQRIEQGDDLRCVDRLKIVDYHQCGDTPQILTKLTGRLKETNS